MKSTDRRVLWSGVVAIAFVLLVVDWSAGGFTRQIVFGTATVTIVTEPPGAMISIDGEASGVTPIDVRVATGPRVIRLQHRFHPDHVEAVTLERGERRTLSIRLEGGVGDLDLVSNPKGATIVLDGERGESKTPIRLTGVTAGTHTVRFELPGRDAVERTVDVLPASQAVLRVELERTLTGALTVQASPSEARVELLDDEIDYHPGVALPVGEYRVTVSAPGYAPVTVPIDVRRGRNLHHVILERTFGTLVLSVEPAGAEVTVTHGSGHLERTERYLGELRLPTGPIRVRARAANHLRYERQVDLGTDGFRLAIRLKPIEARAGDRIRDMLGDGTEAPLLVVVGPGELSMGETAGASPDHSRPVRTVRLLQPFAIGVYEVTRAEYARFAEATGARMPAGADHETERHPVVHVDREDAIAYTVWLSGQTHAHYRLPSEAEWEFAARGGGEGRFGFGDDAARICEYANVADASAAKVYRQWDVVDCDDGHVRSAPVGSFRANAFGLHDMLGNVAEWVLDCWYGEFGDALPDGSPRADAAAQAACVSHVVRGGSSDSPVDRASLTAREPASTTADDRGFRVVRDF